MRLLVVLLAVAAATAAQAQRPLPDRDAFYRAAEANLQRAQRDQWRYAYKERRTDIHANPFGRVGTGGTSLFEVTPGSESGVTFRRLLEKDGMKVPNTKAEKDERRERSVGRSGIEDVVDTLTFTMDRREVRDGRDTIVVSFAPKPDAKPETREGKVAKIFKGLIWVDEEAKEVVRVEATAIDSLSYGLGLIARLNEGTKVTLVREPIDDQIWLPTSIRLVGEGRAVLFRRLNVDFAVDWFDYRRVK